MSHKKRRATLQRATGAREMSRLHRGEDEGGHHAGLDTLQLPPCRFAELDELANGPLLATEKVHHLQRGSEWARRELATYD